jgi:hypothetical protein
MVSRGPVGDVNMDILVERLDGCKEILIRCISTGTYCKWLMTDAQGGTFVDAEFGMDPKTMGTRVFDRVAGKRYYRRWLEQSLEALTRIASERDAARAA